MPMTFKLMKTEELDQLDPARGCVGGSSAKTIAGLVDQVEALAALHVGPWPRYKFCHYSACLNVSLAVRRLHRRGFEAVPVGTGLEFLAEGWVFVCTNEDSQAR